MIILAFDPVMASPPHSTAIVRNRWMQTAGTHGSCQRSYVDSSAPGWRRDAVLGQFAMTYALVVSECRFQELARENGFVLNEDYILGMFDLFKGTMVVNDGPMDSENDPIDLE